MAGLLGLTIGDAAGLGPELILRSVRELASVGPVVVLDVSPEAMRAEFRTTPFPAGTRDSLSTQAVFQVLRGQAGPLKA